jgi:hypothetical protein
MDDDDTGSPPVSRQFSLKPVRGMLFFIGLFAALCLASVPLSIWVLTQGTNNRFYSDVLFSGDSGRGLRSTLTHYCDYGGTLQGSGT